MRINLIANKLFLLRIFVTPAASLTADERYHLPRRFFFFFFFRDDPGKPGGKPAIIGSPAAFHPEMPAIRLIIFPRSPPPLNIPCIIRRISVYCLIS